MNQVVILAGCLSEEQAGVPTTAPAFQAPTAASCEDALFNVVQAERAYDDFLAGVLIKYRRRCLPRTGCAVSDNIQIQ